MDSKWQQYWGLAGNLLDNIKFKAENSRGNVRANGTEVTMNDKDAFPLTVFQQFCYDVPWCSFPCVTYTSSFLVWIFGVF